MSGEKKLNFSSLERCLDFDLTNLFVFCSQVEYILGFGAAAVIVLTIIIVLVNNSHSLPLSGITGQA